MTYNTRRCGESLLLNSNLSPTHCPTSCVSMAPQSPNNVLNVNNSMDSNQLQSPVSPMLGQGQSILIAGAVGAPKKNVQISPTKTSNGIRLVPQNQLRSNKVKIIPAVNATKGSPGTSVIKVQSFPIGSQTTGTQPKLKPKVQKQQAPLIQPRISETTVTTNNTNTGMSGWGLGLGGGVALLIDNSHYQFSVSLLCESPRIKWLTS